MNKGLFTNKKAPYICTPLTGKTEATVFEQLEEIIEHKPDLVEWRADFLTDLADTQLVLRIINKISEKTTIPLLFTIRAEHEGGEPISLTEKEKVHLISEVCSKTAVALIDYETSNEEQYVKAVREVSKENSVNLILSYHNFVATPENNNLIKFAIKAHVYGADMIKLAVMPETEEDVRRLLDVTNTIDHLLDVPVITMSMGDIGGLSRIIGWAYGSIITFAIGAEVSAPGQIRIEKLRESILLTQELVSSWK